jgi:type 1 glutamine amidotransferase
MRVKSASIAITLAALAVLSSLHVLAAEPRVLVYQKNGKGFVHDNLAASAGAIRELGSQNGFGVDVSTNPAVFADEMLKGYRALIFANSNNEAFENKEQRAAFQRYIRGGGGFVGIHSSTGSERHWDYFQQVQGGKFLRHAPLQKFTIHVVDPEHPATKHLGRTWAWADECYFFTNVNPDIRILLALDTKTLSDAKLQTAPGQKSHGVFPLAWCHEFDGGRQFYTSLGHKIEYYSDPVFRQHILGGIRWAMGETTAQGKPVSTNNSERRTQ